MSRNDMFSRPPTPTPPPTPPPRPPTPPHPEPEPTGFSGNFNIHLTYKRNRLRLRVHQDPLGLESSDSDSDSEPGEMRQDVPQDPQQIGSFDRYTNYVQLDHPTDPLTVGMRYCCNGQLYRSVRVVRGLRNNIILLECARRDCRNNFAFLCRQAIYVFGQHENHSARL